MRRLHEHQPDESTFVDIWFTLPDGQIIEAHGPVPIPGLCLLGDFVGAIRTVETVDGIYVCECMAVLP